MRWWEALEALHPTWPRGPVVEAAMQQFLCNPPSSAPSAESTHGCAKTDTFSKACAGTQGPSWPLSWKGSSCSAKTGNLAAAPTLDTPGWKVLK